MAGNRIIHQLVLIFEEFQFEFLTSADFHLPPASLKVAPYCASRGNPAGRPRGSRNALSEEVICALLRDFRKHGEKAIARVRRDHPAAYLKVLALLIPRDIKVEHTPVKELSDEQLESAIALKAMISGENAKVIMTTAERVE